VAPTVNPFVWEVILTFFLVFVVTAVATDARAVRSAAGLCIGGTVVLDALVGGSISGASMNPARSFGPALVAGDFNGLWIYLLAPVVGGVIAALAYLFPGGATSLRRRAESRARSRPQARRSPQRVRRTKRPESLIAAHARPPASPGLRSVVRRPSPGRRLARRP